MVLCYYRGQPFHTSLCPQATSTGSTAFHFRPVLRWMPCLGDLWVARLWVLEDLPCTGHHEFFIVNLPYRVMLFRLRGRPNRCLRNPLTLLSKPPAVEVCCAGISRPDLSTAAPPRFRFLIGCLDVCRVPQTAVVNVQTFRATSTSVWDMEP
ncbi:hypothetical protein NHX12_010436 [Muraenolepis orangiensis]|uniref:Uncharacterized protein n=1 Tax=Muraenolepis orangiensis TaxID=630683 RepID=A0A9Q0DL64_9TELE|nr:hypothetical protein NHX12_010436 [Muraenolepis orangiensis]